MPAFYEMLHRIMDLLEREGRLSYQAMKREFDINDDVLNDLKVELIEVKQIARDIDGRFIERVASAKSADTGKAPPEGPSSDHADVHEQPRTRTAPGEPTEGGAKAVDAPKARNGDPSKRVRRTLLIWIGAIAVGIGVLLPWVRVLREQAGGAFSTLAHRTGLELTKPPFDTILPGIALGLGVVSVFLGFLVSRRTASARFLSFLVALAGLAACGVTAYVIDRARPGYVFSGLEGRTRNELEVGLFVTLVGGILLFLGGVVAFARARKREATVHGTPGIDRDRA